MELLEAALLTANDYDYRSLSMELAYLVEEMTEMFGVIYFLTALLHYVELRGEPLRVGVSV